MVGLTITESDMEDQMCVHLCSANDDCQYTKVEKQKLKFWLCSKGGGGGGGE